MVSKKTFIIAEAGVNHNGSLDLAKKMVDVAIEAKVDAVKFQTFHAEDLVCAKAGKADYQKKSTKGDESQLEMLKSLELSDAEQAALHRYCQDKKIVFLSSPFDLLGVDFLCHTLKLPLIKIASGEITNYPLLLKIAQSGARVILSTGMSTLGEIESALGVLAFGYLTATKTLFPSKQLCEEAYYSDAGQNIIQEKISLLHCTSEYPAPFSEVNLRVIKTLKKAFGIPVGYSDHTPGIAISIGAVACGAQIIEKHFTLDKNMYGPDHQASIDPSELCSMVESIRQVEIALGSYKKIPVKSELKTRLVARKSLVALQKITRGDVFTEINIGCKRPGNGLLPEHFEKINGKCSENNYEKDELIVL